MSRRTPHLLHPDRLSSPLSPPPPPRLLDFPPPSPFRPPRSAGLPLPLAAKPGTAGRPCALGRAGSSTQAPAPPATLAPPGAPQGWLRGRGRWVPGQGALPCPYCPVFCRGARSNRERGPRARPRTPPASTLPGTLPKFKAEASEQAARGRPGHPEPAPRLLRHRPAGPALAPVALAPWAGLPW